MKLGVDFGTTRIVVAYADRGNYPVVVFEAPDGSSQEWFPPLVAVHGDRRIYGWEAWEAQEQPGWTIVRSLKRALESAGPETRVQLGEQVVPMRQLLCEIVSSLRTNLLERSSLPAGAQPGEEGFEVMLGVPANANTNQRFLTTEAFREAGFQVLGLLNEPSAASIEFGHRERASRQSKERRHILVYDLGGGTFDVSLVELDDLEHRVIASEGITTLGGDDFDDVLAGLAMEASGASAGERDSLTQSELFRLHEECRNKKESLHPNTRHLTVDLGIVNSGWGEVSLPVQDFYEHCRSLVEETLHATEDLLTQHGYAEGAVAAAHESTPQSGARLDALYVTGGGSELPLVARMLREVFGRRVKRSAYTRSATAIGLAIQADAQAGYTLREKFMRYFGVWREADAGRLVVFDPLFPRGAVLPTRGDPPLVRSRRYHPIHNIGHFRYLECSHLTEDGRPAGDITLWDDIRFPFDPKLRNGTDLDAVAVERLNLHGPYEGHQVEETYACDSSGAVAVTITDLDARFAGKYRLGRWATKDEAPIVPGRRKRGSAKKQ